MRTIEGRVRAPTASPGQLLSIVGNLSSSSVNAPRHLPSGLQRKLEEVAVLHGGEVKLYGRLFAQWLHFAFPNECPYPHVDGPQGALTPSQFAGGRQSSSATSSERAQHAQVLEDLMQVAADAPPSERLQREADALRVASEVASDSVDEEFLTQWRDEESFFLPQEPVSLAKQGFRVLFQALLIIGVLRVAYGMWANAPATRGCYRQKE